MDQNDDDTGEYSLKACVTAGARSRFSADIPTSTKRGEAATGGDDSWTTESSIPCVRMEIRFVVAAVELGNLTVSLVSASMSLAESVSPGLDSATFMPTRQNLSFHEDEANNLPPCSSHSHSRSVLVGSVPRASSSTPPFPPS